ncbi:MAG: FAD-dependent oxidoreductase [Granulosicoccus sp.]
MSTQTVRVEVIGSGVAGLCCAYLFAMRGCKVLLRSASNGFSEACCSWWAGGMLAPWCELESAEPLIAELGQESSDFWKSHTDEVVCQGSLVLASKRDKPDVLQFASRTKNFSTLDAQQIARLEPDLAGRFDTGLFFETESHLNPRTALLSLQTKLQAFPNVTFEFASEVSSQALAVYDNCDWRVDCRGLAARNVLTDLRGVRGEMLLVKAPDVRLNRPVRLLHPRYPLYIVPRSDHTYMVGATMLESDDNGDVTVRSTMELLSAAYALHPAFAEATIIELGADVRPAFTDNLPALRRHGKALYVNGLYRHGFLCGPAVAQRAVSLVLDSEIDERVVNEYCA